MKSTNNSNKSYNNVPSSNKKESQRSIQQNTERINNMLKDYQIFKEKFLENEVSNLKKNSNFPLKIIKEKEHRTDFDFVLSDPVY